MMDKPEPQETRRKPRRAVGQAGLGRMIWPILVSLVIILGGVEFLVGGLVRQQEAASLAAAPVCASGQLVGCRLDERVTVVDKYTEEAGRSGDLRQIVKVQTPDGSTQIVYATDHDVGLWSRLYTSEELNAELWKGSIIRLDDGAGHYVLADDSPAVTAVLFPIIGAVATIAGGLLLAVVVQALLRQRRDNR
jgi:hypothetical protein